MRSLPIALLLSASASGQTLSEEINNAIDRGIQRVISWQKEDGRFAIEGAGANNNDSYPMGVTGLAVYTLLKSGLPKEDPAIRRAMAFLEGQEVKKTYGAALLILALDAYGDPAFDDRIRKSAAWLEDSFDRRDNLWGYPGGTPDLSNTQFGVLGLWTAEKHGYFANRRLWSELVDGITDVQNDDGGMGYRLSDRPYSHGTMTTAGITVLELAEERLKDDPNLDKKALRARAALDEAWAWFDTHFTATGNPTYGNGLILDRHNHDTGRHYCFHYYYLYGVERIAAIAQRKEIAGRDWYREGAIQLLRDEDPGGGWTALDTTCLALLFLRRATFSGLAGRQQEESIPRAIEWRYTTERPPEDWAAPDFDDSQWKRGAGSFGDFQSGRRLDRTLWNTPDIWIRRRFDRKPDEEFHLYARHDDSFEVYLNGVLAAQNELWTQHFLEYEPAPDALATLEEKGNVLAAHCTELGGAQILDVWLRDYGRRIAHSEKDEKVPWEEPWWRVKPEPDAPFIRRWLVLGPLDDREHDRFAATILPEADASPEPGDRWRNVVWREIRVRGDLVDPRQVLKARESSIDYAFTRFEVARDVEAVLWIGSDDGCRVYVDGELKVSHHAHQAAKPDELAIHLRLKQGLHRLLVKVEQSTGEHGIYARFTRLDGSAAPEIRPFLSLASPDWREAALAQPELYTLDELMSILPVDLTGKADFDKESCVDEIAVVGAAAGYPRWLAHGKPKGETYLPSPGAQGLLAVWPAKAQSPAKVLWKVRVPTGNPVFTARVSPEALSAPGRTSVTIRIWIYDGELKRLGEETLTGQEKPSKRGWRTMEAGLSDYVGDTVMLVIECVAPGEEVGAGGAFLDELAIVQRR